MPVPSVHTEEYEVLTVPIELSNPTRLWFEVKKKQTAGDDPVEEMYLRKYTTGTSRVGREDPEDVTALVNLVDGAGLTDYTDAKGDIGIGSIVSYLSTRQNGVEKISLFIWS